MIASFSVMGSQRHQKLSADF